MILLVSDKSNITKPKKINIPIPITKFFRSAKLSVINSNIITLEVTAECSGIRLDKFIQLKIQQNYPELSRTQIQNLINKGNVKLIGNNKIKSASQKTEIAQIYEIEIDPPKPLKLKGENIPLDIIFEDDDLLVINKQAGISVHPGPGETSGSLVNALLNYCPETLSGIGGIIRPGIVHRLDKNTSGVMLVAKNDLAHQNLSNQLSQRLVKRTYLALCYGLIKPVDGKVETYICRDEKKRNLMRVSKAKGKIAITHYETKEILLNQIFSLVECNLETGRTHQIRVHLNHLKHSIVGDYDYGKNQDKIKQIQIPDLQEKLQKLERQFLHATSITFQHPRNNKTLEFSTKLPDDLNAILVAIKNSEPKA